MTLLGFIFLLVFLLDIRYASKKCKENSPTSLSVNEYVRISVDIPCSLEISGLYQNLDVSWTNFTVTCLSVVFSVK